MENFTPLSSFIGGSLLGLGAAVLMLFNGRIAGISGIVSGLLSPERGDTAWRVWFIGGMLMGPLLTILLGAQAPAEVSVPLATILIAGLLVGVGTRLGSGCTSGHGICGISRLSMRSIAATVTFMGTGALTVFAIRHLFA